MRLVIETSRKVGLPEYSSVGATCRIELDVADGCDAQALYDHARALQAVADRVVDARLAEDQQPATQPAPEPARQPAAVAPAAAPVNRLNGHASNGRASASAAVATRPRFRELPPTRGREPGSRLYNDLPRDGRQLLAWLRKQDDPEELQTLLERYASDNGLPRLFREWDREETRDAVRWLLDLFRVD